YGDMLTAFVLALRGRRVFAITRMAVALAVEMNTLVRTIPASGVAEFTSDAFFFVDARHDFVIQVEMLPFLHPPEALALKFGNRRETLFAHPIRQAVAHVIHNTVAIVHHRCADLHVAAAQKQKLDGIAPIGDAADAA